MMKKKYLVCLILLLLLLHYVLVAMMDAGNAFDSITIVNSIIAGILLVLLWVFVIWSEKNQFKIGQYLMAKKIVIYLGCLAGSVALVLDTLKRAGILTIEVDRAQSMLLIVFTSLLAVYAFWPKPKGELAKKRQ